MPKNTGGDLESQSVWVSGERRMMVRKLIGGDE
jgi:hypothetical protein